MSVAQRDGSIDWEETRTVLGRRIALWQINLSSLLFVLFVAFIGFYTPSSFLPFLVGELGVAYPGAAAIWSGILIATPQFTAFLSAPLWGRLADRVGGRLLLARTVFGFALLLQFPLGSGG